MTRLSTTRLAAALLTGGLGAGLAQALPPMPRADELAAVQPKYPGVNVATPTAADLARCRVENVPGADGKPIGHTLVDAAGRTVRRFLAVGTADYNIKSFYLDGQEVYRENDSNGNGKPDQYRWLGSAGSKWGMDPQETGRVTNWGRISPEEISKELFEAIQAKDPRRVQALLPTEAELTTLGLPATEIAKVMQRANGAAAKLTATAAAMNLGPTAKWIHVELSTPQTTPADAFNGKQDVIRHRNGGVLVDKGEGKSAEFFQTGELVLIGTGWRVIDGPTPGTADLNGTASAENGPTVPDTIKELVAQLVALIDPKTPAEVPEFQTKRAAILEKIVAKLQGDASQEQWLRQLLDAHASAAEAGVKESGARLVEWKGTIDKTAPKSPMAAFAAFRTLGVDYAAKTRTATQPKDVAGVQSWWKEQLEAFVKDYPTAEEAPEALFRLGMAYEFSGKDGEAAAKQWYGTLARNFAGHQLAPQAQGAVRRLESEGQAFSLTGQTLQGQAVNVAQLQGRPTLVYYWASWSRQLKDDATFLTETAKKFPGVNIVTVCMDADAKTAGDAATAAQLPGVHLFQQGNGLATAYGIMGPHLLLIGKDGRVANKNAQIPAVADEIEKMMK